jgi:phosphogluconate dehydratase
MLMEVMGLHMPGAAFVAPNTPLRDALTAAAARRAARSRRSAREYLPLGAGIDERAIVNAIVGLLATGGSTNHTLHLVAMARCAGIAINWDDFSDLSAVCRCSRGSIRTAAPTSTDFRSAAARRS